MGDVEYTFKHALTQEVAYNSVLVERRRLLHERAARDRGAVCRPAGRPSGSIGPSLRPQRQRPKAVEYLGRAGKQSMERSAYSAAARLSGRWNEADWPQSRKAPSARGSNCACKSSSGSCTPQMTSMYRVARRRSPPSAGPAICARNWATDENLFYVLDGLRWACLFIAEVRRARDLAEEQLAIAKRSDDPAQARDDHRRFGRGGGVDGRFSRGTALSRSSWLRCLPKGAAGPRG